MLNIVVIFHERPKSPEVKFDIVHPISLIGPVDSSDVFF